MNPLARFKPPTRDQELAAILGKHNGSVEEVAKELNCPPSAVSLRVSNARPDSLLARFKPLSNEQIVTVLRENGGNVTDAANKLGILPKDIRSRMGKGHSLSRLAPTELDIVELFKKYKGDRDQVAKHLGIERTSLDGLIGRSASDSPLATYRISPVVSEEQLAAALARHGGDQAAAAKDIGLHPTQVGPRIANAALDSPLRRFAITDERIASLLSERRGDLKAVAGELKVTESAVNKRIRKAAPDTPLSQWKREALERKLGLVLASENNFSKACREVGITRVRALQLVGRAKRGSPLYSFAKALDERVAEVLSRNGNNIVAAAREINLNNTTLWMRIMRAPADSPLARFKTPAMMKAR